MTVTTPSPTLQWCEDKLCSLLESPDMLDMAMMMVAMETRGEMLEFLRDLVGAERSKSKKVQSFVDECYRRLQMDKEFTGTAYKKAPLEDVEYMSGHAKPADFDTILSEATSQTVSDWKMNSRLTIKHSHRQEWTTTNKSLGKRRNYVNLKGDEMSGILLPGRYVCHCLAQKHGLINNCMSCGRIVCEQEGEGPCFFCGQLVATPDNIVKIQSGSKKGQQLHLRLSSDKPENFTPISHHPVERQVHIIQGTDYDKAVQHKAKLLEYDRTNIHRSKVIDDESDYFQNTRWLTKKEKKVVHDREEKRKEKVHNSRLQTKITLDFAGRKIVDGAAAQTSDMGVIYDQSTPASESALPDHTEIEPEFIDERRRTRNPLVLDAKHQAKSLIRNQDKEFLIIKDEGMCLTMHQPWASLLVHGIKIHEGRSWYTAHRGRLWIHAAAKQPTTPEISAVQNQYRDLRGNQTEFPEYYPTSCLLGCVDVDEVVPGSDVESEESSSEFIFVCSNPHVLAVPLTLKGQHKVWRLPRDILEIAKASVTSLL